MPHARHEPNPAPNDARAARARSSSQSAALDVFLGEWHMEGKQLAGPIGPAADLAAVQTFEWLEGNEFLIHRFDGHVGASRAACIEIMGFDHDTDRCRAHTFYNNGLKNVWDIERHDGAWLLLGDWNMGGKSLKVRCTITFSHANTIMTSKWESSGDGKHWQAFWETKAHKAVGH
jgi:hypothetical protein